MAAIYARSTDGNNTDDGSTWALAKATLAGAAAIDAAGDTIWVSQAHNESTAAAVTCAWAGTRASPTRVLCGSDAAEPPTSLSTAGVMTTTLGSGITWNGFAYTYGLTFSVGSGNNIATFTASSGGSEKQIYENCSIRLPNTQGTSAITSGANTHIVYKNCTFRFGSAGQGFTVNGVLHIDGGSILSGGTNITTLLKGFSAGSFVLVENFDMSAMSSALALSISPATVHATVIFRNCKLPASWTGTLVASITSHARVSMYNCDDGNTNYRLRVIDYEGNIYSETTLVRSGGATDAATPISWRMVSTANPSFAAQPLYSDPIAVWVEPAGSPGGNQTLTLEILHDSATNLKDDEVWLEVAHLNSGTSYLGGVTSDAKASPVATAADQDTSSATWTTTGMSNPNEQKLVVTVAPARAGFLYCRVALAKASKTIYADPLVTVA